MSKQKIATREDAIRWAKNNKIEIPSGVTELEVDFAYFVVREDLPQISELVIPSTVTNIPTMRGDYSVGPYGYENNPFTKIIVSAKNPSYKSVDGVLFSKDGKRLICYPCGKQGEEYQVPEGVEIIEQESFLNVEHLRKIYLPETVKNIEGAAFSGCENLSIIRKSDDKALAFITENLILRPWRESDAEDLYEQASDPEVGPVAGWPVHTSVDNSLEIIKKVLSADETYAVCMKENNIAVGSIGLIPPAQSHTVASPTEIEIGFWIGYCYWGNGYIPEAVRTLQKHAFEDLGITAMWCGYYEGNEKSKRCQEKCGFKYHHTEENKPCELMGDIRTEHFTYLTKEEWQKIVTQDKE